MIDNYKLYLGDCLEVMKDIPDKSVDLILTDPPYGIGISKNPFRQKHEKKEWDNSIPSKECFEHIFRISKNQIIWGGNYFSDILPISRCFYIWDKVQPEQFTSAMVEMAWVSSQSPAKMFRQRVVTFEKFHPTTKPVNLMEWCLSFFPEAELVMDCFMGSGTTGVACANQNRKFIGIEMDSGYFEIAQERIKNANMQNRLF